MMDLNNYCVVNYSSLKAKGAVKIIQQGQAALISQNQYDSNTGLPIANALYQVDTTSVQNQITNLQNQITSLQAILADCPANAAPIT